MDSESEASLYSVNSYTDIFDDDTKETQIAYIDDSEDTSRVLSRPMLVHNFLGDDNSMLDLNEDDNDDLNSSPSRSDRESRSYKSLDIDHLMGYDKIDDDATKSEIHGPVYEDTIKEKRNFLMQFAIPSLSDISEEHKPIRKSKSEYVCETRGKFVSPIDVEKVSEESESADYGTIAPESTKSVSSPLMDMTSLSADSILSLGSDKMDITDVSMFKHITVKEQPDTFITFKKSFVQGFEVYSSEDELLPNRYELLGVAKGYLTELINKVVRKVEIELVKNRAYNKYDKNKLFQNLFEVYRQLEAEQSLNNFLNSKMYEYYKRAQNKRVMLTLEPRVQSREHLRYINALNLLDHWLNVVAETKKRTAYLLSSVMMDLSYIINIVMGTEEHLDNLILETLTTNRSETMKHIVERELRYMHQKRCEISDARLFLITRKHTLGRIVDKIHILETINEDICMDDFIRLQNQVVALTKKIEERNWDLKRIRLNYQSELHQLQHNREKAHILHEKLVGYELILMDKQQKQDSIRKSLIHAKLMHNKIRKEYSDLSYKGGVMAMPALMYDFDETVDKIKIRQVRVDELKESIKRMTQRIADLESRCI